jgi:hypothetical protein
MPYMHSLMGSHMSIRHRIHNGTALDIQTSLSRYGIAKLPSFLSGDNNIACNTDGTKWLREQRYLEERNYMHLPIANTNSNLSRSNSIPQVENSSMDALFTSVYLY